MQSTQPIMRLIDLSFAYPGGEPVLTGITQVVEPGAVHAVIGPNAAGKSTLLRLMLGQLKPTSGQVQFDGKPVASLSAKRRAADLAYVPQRSTIGFAFSVRQVIEMGRYALKPDAAAIDRAIERCDLKKIEHRNYTELSVGQQQRVLLARSMAQLAGGGRAVLLDELTSAMDLSHTHRVMQTLGELAREGLAVVVVLHDLNLAARYADEVWLLHNCTVTAAGSWEDVMTPAVLSPVYGVELAVLDRVADPGDPLARRPMFDVGSLEWETPKG